MRKECRCPLVCISVTVFRVVRHLHLLVILCFIQLLSHIFVESGYDISCFIPHVRAESRFLVTEGLYECYNINTPTNSMLVPCKAATCELESEPFHL